MIDELIRIRTVFLVLQVQVQMKCVNLLLLLGVSGVPIDPTVCNQVEKFIGT